MTELIVTPLIPRTLPDTAAGAAASEGAGLDVVLDVLNPLQHIPFVSHLYRAATGDTISTTARVAGGGLFGGVIGAAASFVTALIEEATGESLLDSALSVLPEGGEASVDAAALYRAPDAKALEADHGEAFVHLLTSGEFAQAFRPVPPRQAVAGAAVPELGLRSHLDGALGLSDTNMQRQFAAAMHKQAGDLV